ncbi:ankyrin repeat domain-containing protein [Rickettsia asembonensis]|uniref:Uncharacterized protein n=1 Tax=Rickettsia asembonensis TaxID=1068590 RepID=A0A0C2MME3_9RICK|nr:ankyrin repeat domain-containing protein [Rickettsia asembonensis]KIJ88381.1 hypothetical protein SB78_06085 [Rickettsia asembonensis]
MKKVDKEIVTSEYISEALTISIYTNNIEIITYLLSLEKTNINAKDEDGDTPLHQATAANNPEIMELYLSMEVLMSMKKTLLVILLYIKLSLIIDLK